MHPSFEEEPKKLESFGDWVQIPPLKSLLAHFRGEVTLSDPFLVTSFLLPNQFCASKARQYGILTG